MIRADVILDVASSIRIQWALIRRTEYDRLSEHHSARIHTSHCNKARRATKVPPQEALSLHHPIDARSGSLFLRAHGLARRHRCRPAPTSVAIIPGLPPWRHALSGPPRLAG